MKKKILFLALSMTLCFKSFSQIIFEKGYFIDESNQRTECLIKNIDWKNNPTEFEYKLTQDADIKKADIKIVKEFGIISISKYIRALVKIDRSSDNVIDMSYDINPIFQEEQLFLKVLIEGKTSLLLYEDNNLTRYFYNTNDSEISQLVYKRYLTINNDIAQNNYFRQQLFNDLKCQMITVKDVEYIKYNKRDLEQFFIKYNECTNSGYINHESKQKNDLFNLSFRPGLNYSNLALGFLDVFDYDFENKFNFRFGIETEFILPFNKNKWGIIIEPTYQYFNSEESTETNNVSGGILVLKVNYQSIELPVGIRHYFYFNDESKIFANISYIFDFSFNSPIEFARIDGSIFESLDIKSRRNIALGIGYKYQDRYSLEIRYQTSREIISDYLFWKSNYRTFSVIFGYSLF